MASPKLPWPSVLLALVGAGAMLWAEAGLGLTASVLLLWLGTLWLAHPAPVAAQGGGGGVRLTRARMEDLIEPLGIPLMLLDRGRITLANAAAREALGAHIVDQDARIALRHPDAIALLDHPGSGTTTVAGLTGARSIWQVSRRQIDERHAMIELVNRTVEADIGRAHTDFVANASHELSTPLASIIGYVETLAEPDAGIDKATAAKFHATVLREARRLQALVRDLMSLSRVEAEKHDPPRDTIDLGQLTASIASEMAASGGEGRVAIEWPREPALVTGDRAQLDQLVRNLVDNALKYGDPDQPVSIAIEHIAGQVVLAVADRGAGIAPEHLPHLTRRFYRTDPGRSRAAGGTGLGLAIVKHIVERHQGRLDIDSRVGEGTTVTVRFDAAASLRDGDQAALS